MRGGRTRGWTRFEYQTSVPGECGRRGRPDLEYQLFLNGRVPTSRFIGAPIRRREIWSVTPIWRLISILVKFDLNRRWSAPALVAPPTWDEM
jgi:hypothetical protein